MLDCVTPTNRHKVARTKYGKKSGVCVATCIEIVSNPRWSRFGWLTDSEQVLTDAGCPRRPIGDRFRALDGGEGHHSEHQRRSPWPAYFEERRTLIVYGQRR